MSNQRRDITSSVQLAFSPDPSPNHCGYCDTVGSCTVGACLSAHASSITLRHVRSSNCGYCQREKGKISFGFVASNMLVDDYQILMDRGWRKCGTYYYKALMDKTCCPLYTIRCDANNFQISSSQRRVIQGMNRFINDDVKPNVRSKPSTATASNLSQTNKLSTTTIPKESSSKNVVSVEQWLKTSAGTHAHQLLIHLLNNDTPPSDAFLKQLKSRQKRWYKKLLKLKSKNQLSLTTDIRRLIKRFDRMKTSTNDCTLEQMLAFNEKTKNRFELRLVRSYPPSKEFTDTLKASHAVYQRYQMAIHHDSKDECSYSQFKRFLCESSLAEKSPRISSDQTPSCGYGCFHLQYYLNSKIIACSVIDILPGGVSSVYFYYDPDYGFLRLGVYSALRELELTRRLVREIPSIKYYYLGFYVHSCVKMRYKGQYKPSFLLCPETYTWHPIEKCIPLLNAHKYARFESDPNKVDDDEEKSLENLKLGVHGRVISPTQLQQLNENYFFYILERFQIFAKFTGRICANRIVIELN